ncbi:MAG: thiol:disulfide interchange protein DsbG [Steroidobacteraceae bacterium]
MKTSLPRRRLFGFGLLLLALPAFAATRPSSSSLPPMLVSLTASGKLKVLSQFPTEVPGLTGYLISNRDGTQVIYSEHGYLFVGHLISPKGVDLTDNYQQRYGPKPDYAAVVGKLASGGHLISEGRATAPLLYVFADPNCSICYRFYKMAEPLVASGKLQLRWVMVAFLQSSSAAKATAILSARDPRGALHSDEDRFDTVHEAGGIAPARSQQKGLQQVLQAHLSAMDAVGGIGTPTLLYRDEHGHWGAVVGLPTSDWLAQYSGGKPLPAQPSG